MNTSTPRTERIRSQALAALNGIDRMGEEPREPTPAEAAYLSATELFKAGRYCAGCDKLDEGDALSGIDPWT